MKSLCDRCTILGRQNIATVKYASLRLEGGVEDLCPYCSQYEKDRSGLINKALNYADTICKRSSGQWSKTYLDEMNRLYKEFKKGEKHANT